MFTEVLGRAREEPRQPVKESDEKASSEEKLFVAEDELVV